MRAEILWFATTWVVLALYGCGGGSDSQGLVDQAADSGGARNADTSLESAQGTGSTEQLPRRLVINGGFETGDNRGWTVSNPLGHSPSEVPPERPAGIVSVVDSWIYANSTRLPYRGYRFMVVGTGDNRFPPGPTIRYEITASQTLFLRKGDRIKGHSAYFNGDFSRQDSVWVKVFNPTGNVLIATPWIEYSGNSMPGDMNSAPYLQGTDWTDWQWRAPRTGVFTLRLGATTCCDDQFPTFGFHDAIKVVFARE